MKKIPFILVLLVAISFSNCKNPNSATPSVSTGSAKDSAATAQAAAVAAATAGSKVVYVNIDSLQERYTWFKQKNEGFAQKQRSAESSFEAKARAFQNDVVAMQQKAQSGTVPPAQLQQEEQSLGARQQALTAERERKTKELSDEAMKFNEELRKRIKDVLASVQKQKGYDYVISYSDNASSQFWYANPSLDITSEVLAMLNAAK
jgi:outer membrane protein